MTSPVIQFKRGSYSQLPGLRSGEPGFTTDKYDLFVGLTSSLSDNKFFGSHRYWRREDGTTSLRFSLVDKDGDNNIQIKSPDTLSGITTYTLPETPIDTFFLKTDADGVLSWSNQFPNLGISEIVVSGISTFQSQVLITDTTESYDKDTGALIIDGGVGIEKNLNVGGRLHVTGISTFVGSVTFEGGTINLGDSIEDNINVAGEFISNLNPNSDDTYDIGISTQRWRNAQFSGVGTFASGAYIDNVQIGLSGTNEIDTSTGDLILDSATDLVLIDSNLSVSGVSTFTGSIQADSFTAKDLRISVSGNTEIDTVLGNLILDSASGMTYIDDDLTIAGNLYINGSTTQVNTEEIKVEDRTIELGLVDGNAPSTSTTWDLGVLFNYHDGSSKKSGVIWEHSTQRFTFTSDVSDGGGTGNSNPQMTYTTYAPIEVNGLWVNDCAGQSQVISCTGAERFLENITIDGGSF